MSDMMPSDGTEPQADSAPLPELKFLKTLVTVLAGTMIVGLIAVIALLVIRLNATSVPVLVAPGDFTLPAGVGAVGISVIDGQSVIVGDDGVIRVYDSQTRTLVQEFRIGE